MVAITGAELGFTKGQIVQEFYYDDDVDETLRSIVEEVTGEQLVDDLYEDVVDGTIIWWREEDAEEEDLADLLVDAVSNLDDRGLIWVMTPKTSLPGHVRPSEIEEAAQTTGLRATTAKAVSENWTGMRLASRSRS
ncbi:DUF3052 domain-containing protein [Actinomyces sp. zg-332]|uniref:DUF3052 domain-containing protein n=1 Tax=Actinomyces sp. zg-332 TaxID=2708340 RepID=UPI00141DFC4C|nr:DUF3052 domain-containing protein [Actinomyces sp. zg-332]QPK93743.1 DUF3052 domain-containing protein [Actinomyces sp. zg-332]